MTANRLSFLSVLSLFLALCAIPVSAETTYRVGDSITDPTTGVLHTVALVGDNGTVLTDDGLVIITKVQVGDILRDPDDNTKTLTVFSVDKNPMTNLIERLTFQETLSDMVTHRTAPVVTDASGSIPPRKPERGPGSPGGPLPINVPTGNRNVFQDIRTGANGGDGRDGYGIELCFPFFGCWTLGISAKPGGAGQAGPNINDTVSRANGDIQTVSDRLPGIIVTSIGGSGGKGGSAFGALPAGDGGAAGSGGSVTVTSNVDISTSGRLAYGIQAQSRSGQGGQAGSGFILSGGGEGGRGSSGGPVLATNTGNVSTLGDGSIGMRVQSLGGAAGNGGDSFGIVGAPGSHRGGATRLFGPPAARALSRSHDEEATQLPDEPLHAARSHDCTAL